ncbi:MAG: O-antigen ligase family protein [Minisyncoccota bacterium]
MKYIERAYPWLLIAPAVLPVVIWGGLIYPYLVPKTLLFYAISLVAIGTFAVLAAYGRMFYWARIKRWEAWVPVLLLALAYVASAAGLDFYQSFWSLFVRGDGLLMLTCAVASFYLILLYADSAFFKRLVYAVAAVGSFVAIYGIAEWLGIIDWLTHPQLEFPFIHSAERVGSLLGNAAFFAGYLGVALFATLAARLTLSEWWRRAAALGAALQAVAIVLTATRGTILALAVAALAALVYVAFQRQRPLPPEKKAGALRAARPSLTPAFFSGVSGLARIILAAVVILSSFFFVFRGELAKVPFEPVARVASISTTDPDVASRLFIWKNMVGQIEHHPLLGVGAEHIDALFNNFYDPTQIQEQWFDRSHNAFLDYAAQYGIGGLLLYLALIAAFFTAAVRLMRRGERPLAGISALLAVVYAVQNFFVFDTISSFWLLLALLAAILALSSGDVPRETLPLLYWTRYAAWVFAFVLVVLIIPVSVRPALAAYDLSQAYKYQLTDVPQEASYLSHGFALGTYGDLEYGYEAYDMYANNQAAALSGNARVDAYHVALAILTTDFNRYTYDARTALYLAHVLSLAPQSITIDQNLLTSALERAIRLSPKRAQPWYILVNLSLDNANSYPPQSASRIAGYAAAQDLLTRYIALVPASAEPHFVLAQLLLASGDVAGAKAEAAKGKADYQSDLETASRAASYYENVLDLPNAAFFLTEVVSLDPNNAAAKSDLAKIQAYEQSKK